MMKGLFTFTLKVNRRAKPEDLLSYPLSQLLRFDKLS